MDPILPKKTRIDKIQDKLYEKNSDSILTERHDLHPKDYSLKNEWRNSGNFSNENIKPEKKISIFNIFLIAAIVFFIGAASYAGFFFYQKNSIQSEVENIDIRVLGPVSISGGDKLDLDVIIQNNNLVGLEGVHLIVEYPEGTKNPEDLSQDLRRERFVLENISSGSTLRETISSVLFGEEGSLKNFTFRLEYRTESSNALFEIQKNYEITLGSSPLRITTEGLREISSGQNLDLKFKLESNSTETLRNVMVIANYPFGFNLTNSNIEPSIENNIWIFDTLEPNQEIIVELSGIVTGQDQEERVFRFNTGLQSSENPESLNAVFSTTIYSLLLRRAFVDVQIRIADNPNPVVSIDHNQTVTGQLTFINNTNEVINNLNIELEILGQALNKSSVVPDGGFYNSGANKIFWNAETNSTFARIEPRAQRNLTFRFSTFNLNSENNQITNPEISISAIAKGVRIFANNVEDEVVNETAKIVRVNSFFEPSIITQYEQGLFENSGPVPPVAEQQTTYSIFMTLKNSSNVLEDTEFRAILPSYVEWLNEFRPQNASVSYDPNTREIVWRVGRVENGIGYTKTAPTLNFQVRVTPSLSQVGQPVNLLRNTTFRARDIFTGEELQRSLRDPNTRLQERSGVSDFHENVIK